MDRDEKLERMRMLVTEKGGSEIRLCLGRVDEVYPNDVSATLYRYPEGGVFFASIPLELFDEPPCPGDSMRICEYLDSTGRVEIDVELGRRVLTAEDLVRIRAAMEGLREAIDD